jgi:hypothetical protein
VRHTPESLCDITGIRRVSEQGLNGSESMDTIQFGGIDH